MTVRDRLDSLLSALREERVRSPDTRETQATDAALDAAITKVSRARDRVTTGDGAGAAMELREVARQVTDSWEYSAPLSVSLIRCSQDLARANSGGL